MSARSRGADVTQPASPDELPTAAWDASEDAATSGAVVGGVPVASGDAGRGQPAILPTTLGDDRYRVTAQLGVGGMGVVVRARDVVLGRDVAVKLLADNLALDAGARARFLQEARAAAAVSDPRVVTVHDVGEEHGRPYMVMELVDGPSLSQVLATDGPVDADLLATVARDALGALAAAHTAGLLHRDVKPGNLLIAPDGTVKVTDFGVAVAIDDERLTRTGFVIGTAGYLAPERRQGREATVRTDLWALGATLTELATGLPPGEAAIRRLTARDDLPVRLRELLRRLLAEHPEDRPTDAIAALELLADDPQRSGAPTPPPPARTPTTLLPTSPGADARHGPATSEDHEADRLGGGGDGRRRRTARVGLLVALVAGALLAVTAAGGGAAPDADEEPFGPVVVDPDDPAGDVRELAELLRDHSGD